MLNVRGSKNVAKWISGGDINIINTRTVSLSRSSPIPSQLIHFFKWWKRIVNFLW